MGEVLKKFGRYFLLDRIAQGGMAEIYRARLVDQDAAGRIIVIKRIQSGYGANSEFIQMFKSEIKVTMGFNHPNIVQVYDFGEEQEQPYIAMELVDGKNLRQFLTKFAEAKKGFPPDLAAFITEQAAAGLQYAHSFKDKITGEPLHIIHRDISPQNILISYEGNVKVIDFGIAKATVNSEHTRDGIIKGKPSYLSPEQITGRDVDARADIFALGTVVWELLTGRKLFTGDSDLAVLKLIESCTTHVKPPSTYNPEVPKELDYIILKSLTKQKEQRYQTAEDFRRALHKFIYAYNPDFNPGDLSYYAKDLFKNDIVEDRKLIQKLNEKAVKLITSGSEKTGSEGRLAGAGLTRGGGDTTVFEMREKDETSSKPGKKNGTKAAKPKVEVEIRPGGPDLAKPSSPRKESKKVGPNPYTAQNSASFERNIPKQRSSTTVSRSRGSRTSFSKIAMFGGAALLAAAFFGKDFGIRVPILTDLVDSVATGGGELLLESESKESREAKIYLDDKQIAAQLPLKVTLPSSGPPVTVQVDFPDGCRFRESVSVHRGESKVVSVKCSGDPTPGGRALGSVVPGKTPLLGAFPMRLRIQPMGPGTTVTVNGAAVDVAADPVVKIPLDALVDLVVERGGYRPVHREFVVGSDQAKNLAEWPVEVVLEPTKFGYLTIRTTPSSDAYLIPRDGARNPSSADDKPITRKTPFESEKVPVGTYTIKLVNELLGMEKVETVTIQEGRAVTLDVKLGVKN